MKKSLFIILSILSTFVFSEQVKHRFICIDNGGNQLVHVNQFDKTKNWKTKLPAGSRDLQILGNNKILVSHGDGAAEYSLTDGKLLKVIAKGIKQIQSARRLKDGKTVTLSISGEITEFDQNNNFLRKFKIDQKGLDLRLLRTTPNGNYLVGAKKPFAVLEVSPKDGKVIKTYSLPHKGYKAILTDKDTILASTGDAVKVVEIDPKTNKVFSYVGGKEDHPELGLDFFSGFDLLANGNIVAANWLGHGKHGTASHLIEFDRKNGVVWEWADHKMARQITNLLVLDNLDSYEKLYQGYQNKKVAPLSKTDKAISLEKAYEISSDYSKFIQTKAGPIIGYKVAYASLASQQRWNIKAPVFGPLYESQKISNGSSIKLSDFVGFHIETEVGFTISKDITKPISTVLEAEEFIRSVHTTFDIPNNFFDGKINVSDVAAAGGCAANLVVGKGVSPKRIDFSKMVLKAHLNNKEVYQGKATNVMGDPRLAVVWLANTLISQGKILKAGDIVLSGAVAPAYFPKGEMPAKGTYLGTAGDLPPIKIKLR